MFIGGLQAVLNFFLGFLPTGTLLPGLVLPTGWLYGYNVLNAFLPISEVLSAASLLVGLRVAIFTGRVVTFFIPFIGGKS